MIETLTDPLARYAKPPAEVSPEDPTRNWEELTSAWLEVRNLGDASNWTLGDIASEVERSYGRKRGPDGRRPLEIWAESVGERPETVRVYAWVSRTFPRREDRATSLSWTHYRTVARTGDAAMAWINEALANNWTADQLDMQIKGVQEAAAVEEGRPCEQCGSLLPESGSIHVRVNGRKIASLCRWVCAAEYAAEMAAKEAAEKEECDAAKAAA